MEQINLTHLLDAYHGVAQKFKLNPMRLQTFTRNRVVHESGQAAIQHLQEFLPQEGWLQFQATVLAFTDGRFPDMDASVGMLLEAEVSRDSESLHVRRNADGYWIVTRFSESAESGEQCLAEDITLIGTADAPGNLSYTRYWQLDQAHGMRQVAARFIGFQTGKKSR